MLVLAWIMFVAGLASIALGWLMRRNANRDLTTYMTSGLLTDARRRKGSGTVLIIVGIILIIAQATFNN
jgi:hypothetical protein